MTICSLNLNFKRRCNCKKCNPRNEGCPELLLLYGAVEAEYRCFHVFQERILPTPAYSCLWILAGGSNDVAESPPWRCSGMLARLPISNSSFDPKKISWCVWKPFVLSQSKHERFPHHPHLVSIQNPVHPSTGLRANGVLNAQLRILGLPAGKRAFTVAWGITTWSGSG